MKKQKTSLRRLAALMLTSVVLAGIVLTANAEVSMTSVLQDVQLAYIYSMTADPATLVAAYDQRIAGDPQDVGAYAGRAILKKAQMDMTGAKADLDTALGQLETGNPLENMTVKLVLYPYHAAMAFELCDEAQYLSDMRTLCDLEEQYLNLMADPRMSAGQPELASQLEQIRTQLGQKRTTLQEIQNWYSNGEPAASFTAGHATVTGGKGSTAIQIREEWNEGGADAYTLYDTSFQLSQPVSNVARRCANSDETLILGLDEQPDAVCYQVPAGTVITMRQNSRLGKSALQTDTQFSYENSRSGRVESLTVEAGKTYVLNYAGSDSLGVVFTGV